MKNKDLPLFILGLWFFSLVGCAIINLKIERLPDADLSQTKSFYVVWLEGDDRGLHDVIRDELISLGFSAESGNIDNAPAEVDAIVTYEDRWFWDITNYLIQLNIEIRDSKTMYPLAVGESVRTSMARKSPEEMAREILIGIFQKKT